MSEQCQPQDAEQVVPTEGPATTRTHEIKIWPQFYADVIKRTKRYEVRVNDRAYRIGDYVRLREWDPVTKEYTGSSQLVRIMHLSDHSTYYMIPNHLAIFGFEIVP